MVVQICDFFARILNYRNSGRRTAISMNRIELNENINSNSFFYNIDDPREVYKMAVASLTYGESIFII